MRVQYVLALFSELGASLGLLKIQAWRFYIAVNNGMFFYAQTHMPVIWLLALQVVGLEVAQVKVGWHCAKHRRTANCCCQRIAVTTADHTLALLINLSPHFPEIVWS
jgi:hypothetical protein